MKMNYLQKNNNLRLTKKSFLKALYFFIFLSFVNFLFSDYIRPVLYKLGKPQTVVYKNLDNFSLYLKNIFSSKYEILKENADLKYQVSSLKDQVYKLQTIEDNYNKLLNISTSTDYINLSVVSKPPFSPYDTLILNNNENIKVSDLVFYNEILLGDVSSLGHNITVKLLSSSKKENSFYVDRTSNPVTVFGMGSGNFYARVPKDFDINLGDILIYNLDKRHKVARVYSIDSHEDLSFKDVYFKIPISIYSISFVNILK